MVEYKYNDGLRPGGRRPRLYLARGSEVVKFAGKSIPGFCTVATEKYEKAGKWSNTDYVLLLEKGVRPLFFLSPLHGTWGEEFGTWLEVADALGLPVEKAKEIVAAEYPRTAQRLDEVEAVLSREDGGPCEEVITIVWPRGLQEKEVRGQTVAYLGNEEWALPRGWRLIDKRLRPGYKGGYYELDLVVPCDQAEG